jgi:hypothetical protein
MLRIGQVRRATVAEILSKTDGFQGGGASLPTGQGQITNVGGIQRKLRAFEENKREIEQ